MALWHVIIAFCLAVSVLQSPPAGPAEPETISVPPAVVKSADELPVPPDAVLVISDDLAKAVNAMKPGAVVLSPERYQHLMELAQRAQKPTTEPLMVGACRYSGTVEADALGKEFLRLQAVLEFRTTADDVTVPIGFKGIRLTGATLDGDTPVWATESDGLAVLVKAPGVHKLALEMYVAVTRSGLEKRVSIERAPPAAITKLDMTVPGAVATAVVKGGGPLSIGPAPGQKSQLSSAALGVLKEFDLTWQLAAPAAPPGPPQIVVQGDLRVHLDVAAVHTEARLRLETRQGSLAALRLRLPADASILELVSLAGSDDQRGAALEWTADKPGSGIVAVKLKQPLTVADPPITLRLRLQQTPPGKPGTPLPIALVEVLEPQAAGQTGTIAIWQGLGVRAHMQHTLLAVSPQELAAVEQRSAGYAYRYWKQPVRLEAWFDLAPAAPPVVEVRATHALRLVGQALLLASEFEIVPKPGTGVQDLEVRWPKGFTLDRRIVLTNLVETIELVESTVRLRLAGRQQDRFSFKLEGLLLLGPTPSVSLELPLLHVASAERAGKKEAAQIVHRAGEVNLSAADAEIWLQEGTTGLRLEGQRLPELQAPLRGTAIFQLDPISPGHEPRLVLAWQPRRPEVRASALVFVTNEQVQVRQTLECQWAGAAPTQLWLRIPRALEKLLRLRIAYLSHDGQLVAEEAVLLERPRQSDAHMIERALVLPRDLPARTRIELEWRGPRVTFMNGDLLAAPLVVPSPGEMLDRGGEVRLWCGRGLRLEARPEGLLWKRASLPQQAEGFALPALELHSTSLEAPLELWCTNAPTSTADALAERVLVEVRVLPDGNLDCRASFRLVQLHMDQLRVSLPGNLRTLVLQRVLLNATELSLSGLEFGPDPEQSDRCLLTIRIAPALLRETATLAISYRTPSPRRWLGAAYAFPAPVFVSPVPIGHTRWRVELPAGALATPWRSAAAEEQSWHWWGWLRPPSPGFHSAEMRAWLGEVAGDPAWSEERPALSFGQLGTLGTLPLVLIPRQPWLLGCSLFVLLCGLLCYCYPPRHGWLWLGCAFAVLAVLGLWVPEVFLALLFGAQPGAVVLFTVLTVLWLWRRRWRRQLVLMPGFARRAPDSSLLRSVSGRQTREASSAGASSSRQPTEPPV